MPLTKRPVSTNPKASVSEPIGVAGKLRAVWFVGVQIVRPCRLVLCGVAMHEPCERVALYFDAKLRAWYLFHVCVLRCRVMCACYPICNCHAKSGSGLGMRDVTIKELRSCDVARHIVPITSHCDVLRLAHNP